MAKQPFEPSGVTKPIQLLSAWLIGLILINGSFLGAAALITHPSWAPGFLVICAAATVPIFLGALFLLQTKFRPEMQEDTFYARYLERKSVETQSTELVRIETATTLAPERDSIGTKSLKRRSPDNMEDGVWVNDLLPNFGDIIDRLSSEGIEVSETFGSSGHDSGVPSKFIASVGRDFDPAAAIRLIKLLVPLGLEGVSLVREDYNDNRFFVGSYIYKARPDIVKPVTDDLVVALEDNVSDPCAFHEKLL
jgi:hypothetical protein